MWLISVCGIAAVQVAVGLAGLALSATGVEWQRESGIPDWQRGIAILSSGALAAYLLLGAHRDERVEYMGAFFLLVAVDFANPPIRALVVTLPEPGAHLARLLQSFTVDAFMPALVWLFFRDFPRTLELPRTVRLYRMAIGISIAAAAGLIAANLVIGLRGESGALAPFDRWRHVSHYWTIVFGLILPALPVAFWRARHAPLDERRRLAIFVVGLTITPILPVLYAALPPLAPQLEAVIVTGAGAVLRPLSLAMVLATLGITAYAVMVQHVLDVRVVLRKAAQYALARLGFGALAAIPFALLAVLVFRLRSEPVTSLFEGWRPLQMAALIGAGTLVLRLRRPVMGAIERLLFREAYDSRRILAEVTAQSRAAKSIAGLAHSLTTEVDRALHLESIGLLVEAPEHDAYLPLAGAVRRLERSSPLVELLAKETRPLRVDLDRSASPLQSLPEIDRIWLADAGAAVLVPLIGTESGIAGILALGPKRSELPYSREDLLLLSALGGSVGITLEHRRLRETSATGAMYVPEERSAAECASCGRVEPPKAVACTECGGSVRDCPLPRSLFGKYRLDRRIGEGGMGVVYRATDLSLGRPVALKTLPATSPEDSARLRREARAMAAITHPNLALIFGVETWQGTPILVIEYLAGNTLAERLATGPLAWGEALELCLVLADVLERVHSSGILHRDVKPSNIAFTEEKVPKLLDFGLVQIAQADAALRTRGVALVGLVAESGVCGTPLYMSPEALAGERSDPTFDLWSLGVVAFEAIAGRHPFERETPEETLDAIQRGSAIGLREARTDCPGPIVDLFERVLARERNRRPATARELTHWLRSTAEAAAA